MKDKNLPNICTNFYLNSKGVQTVNLTKYKTRLQLNTPL